MNAVFLRRVKEIREERGASTEAPSPAPVKRCRDRNGRFVSCGSSHA